MPGGYVFNLDSAEARLACTRDGVYGTVLPKQPGSFWSIPSESTLADFATMKPGDNVYFFHDRYLFGVGALTPVDGAVVHLNFPHAGEPKSFEYESIRSSLLYDQGPQAVRQRWICTFRPDPAFFTQGVDMDDVLSSVPEAFKMLRVFWSRSFIKLGIEENAALKDVLLRANRAVLTTPTADPESVSKSHAAIETRRTNDHEFTVAPVLAAAADGTKSKHEMAIEAAILHMLTSRNAEAEKVFGSWDYLARQVPASPFKPPDYMDKMDLFGVAFIPGYEPSIAGLLIGELKRDKASPDDVNQLMKYVDWARSEYAFGDYSLISAFLVAHDFSDAAIAERDARAFRLYTTGLRPVQSKEWRGLTLVRYRVEDSGKHLGLQIV